MRLMFKATQSNDSKRAKQSFMQEPTSLTFSNVTHQRVGDALVLTKWLLRQHIDDVFGNGLRTCRLTSTS